MTRPARSDPVQDSAPAPPLNENHVRRIQATFWYVDDLLRGIEALTHPDASPFVRERPDLSQDEARMLLSFVSLARNRMLAALDRLGIPRPEQKLSARRSVATALLYAEISLSELDTRSLRGYGALDPMAGEEITALSADLQSLMRRGTALLKEQEEGGLAEQVAGLAGPAGDVLRKVLAVSTARGLTEMRPLIAAAAERAAATTLDVGVFGRVSSGKSSLINALVGEGVLPVGATPVTAVPLRVGQGPHSVEVRFRDGRTEQIPLSALPELATEEKNPQNARGVRSIEVTVPGAPPGLRLLDTPGTGSLASSGSAQAFAWLPRCDLGLVLVAAGTPLGRDETALLSGLRHAGIDCSVILSKADLLDPADRERARGYIAGELVPVLGPDQRVEVRALSTREGQSAGLDALRAEVLLPLASEHVQRATEALRTRLRRLVALTAAAMNGGPAHVADAGAIDFEKQRGAAAEAVGRTTDALANASKQVLEDAAEAVAASWARGEDGAPAARSAIVSAASRALAAVREAVDRARSQTGEGEEAAARRLPPLFDPEFLDAIKTLPPRRLAPGLLRRSRAQSAVVALLPFLDQALARYAARLQAWGQGALRELRPAGQPAAATDARIPELAGLDALITQVGGSGKAQAQPTPERISLDAR
jgi:GTP-binding protein EngB required for normal cell division